MDLSCVTVVIPALNEEQSLPLVLADLPAIGRVIVVDNGSTDGTAGVARDNGADVVSEPRRGYGAACLAGLARIALDIQQGNRQQGNRPPQIIVFLDADYSDYPEQLSDLVQPILEGTADFVLGSRLLGVREPGAMPPQSLYGNRLACWLMRIFWNASYTDLGPFRAIAYEKLVGLNMCDTNFGWTIEMQIKATQAGLKTLELPVRYRRRIGVSKISQTVKGTIQAGTKILYTVAKYRLRGGPSTRPISGSQAVSVDG